MTAHFSNRQQGAVLIVSLIMLLLLTLLGVSAMKTSLTEEKMAGNSRDRELAFQAAETALRDAELWLAAQPTEIEANATGSNRIWTGNAMDPNTANAANWWQERNATWWANNADVYVPADVSSALSMVNTNPRTIIEYKQFVSDTLLIGSGSDETGMTYYQVTARGTGGSDQARVLLQSTTARRY
ncbi:MAG: PilX N-terminal domain-containing pilus assembly protein [Gammaproteobacteria bacterium]|nr:PilX N-terminal domain-containing pilus assembly protein [Gammaproteobacteria bacterium]